MILDRMKPSCLRYICFNDQQRDETREKLFKKKLMAVKITTSSQFFTL